MGSWFIILIVAEIVLFLLYIHYLKRYPVLQMPFDYQYRVFKRAYRAYRPVKEGKKLYKVFADDFLHGYKRSIERKTNYEGHAVAHRVCNIIENHREMVERYFAGKFGYVDYLNLKGEYDLFQEQAVEVQSENADPAVEQPKFQRTVSLRRKVLLFESLFRVCKVDASNADKARFIRDLLEVEPNTKEIGNTNTYKILKSNNKELLAKGEIEARIRDYWYVAEQLERLGLEKERTLILNEIKELEGSILE